MTSLRFKRREALSHRSRSRYSFNRVENGFVRFDNTNGEIAYCSAQTAGWICQTVPIDRASTTAVTENAQKDVLFLDRLKAEIASLAE